VIPETPVRVEYALTKKGRALGEAIGAISNWAEKYIPLDTAAGKPARKAAGGRRSAVR
jgi:DNA-binding HxlR family transcriptional regulator